MQRMQPQQQAQVVQATPDISFVEPTHTTPPINYTQTAQTTPINYAQTAKTTPVASYAQSVQATPAVSFAQPTSASAFAQFTPSIAFAELFQPSPSTHAGQAGQVGVATSYPQAGQAYPADPFSQSVALTPSIAFIDLTQAPLNSPLTHAGQETSPVNFTQAVQTPVTSYAQSAQISPAVAFPQTTQTTQTPPAVSYAQPVQATPAVSFVQPTRPARASVNTKNVRTSQATPAVSQAQLAQATPSMLFAELTQPPFSDPFTQAPQTAPALSFAQTVQDIQFPLVNPYAQLGQVSQSSQTTPAVTFAQPTQAITAASYPVLPQQVKTTAPLPSPQTFHGYQFHSGFSPLGGNAAAGGQSQVQANVPQPGAQRQLYIPQPKSILGSSNRSKPAQKGAARRAVPRPETSRQSPTPNPLAAQKPKKVTKPSRPTSTRPDLLNDLIKRRASGEVEGLLRQQYRITDPIPAADWNNIAVAPKPPMADQLLSEEQLMQWQVDTARHLKYIGVNGPYPVGDYLCEVHSKTGDVIRLATRVRDATGEWSWINLMNGNPFQSQDQELCGRPIATSDGAFLGLAASENEGLLKTMAPLVQFLSADHKRNQDPRILEESPLRGDEDPVFFQAP